MKPDGGVSVESSWLDCMKNIPEPYVIHYPQIAAVADETGTRVELIEFFDCVGGAMWSAHHYAQSPLVESVRCVGGTMRYLLRQGTVDLALEGSKFPAGVKAVYEIVIDGLDEKSVAAAMAAGIRAAVHVPGVKFISAGNFGGTLGPYKIELHKVL